MDPKMTLLRLASIDLPPYSARGLTQTLQPVGAAAAMRRNVNGSLVDIADPVFRKYESTITGDDVEPPAFEMVWPGRLLTVDCAVWLSRVATTDDTEGSTFGRPAVEGSTTMEGGFIRYRPRLEMRVTGWNMTEDEWRRGVAWTLSLEEV